MPPLVIIFVLLLSIQSMTSQPTGPAQPLEVGNYPQTKGTEFSSTSSSSSIKPELFSRLPPTIELVILVHPYNKAAYLPFTLGGLEAQNYPRSRVRIRFITERLFGENSVYDDDGHSLLYRRDQRSIEEDGIWLDDRLRLNDLTIEMLKRWTRRHQAEYNDIELVISNANLKDHAKEDKNYWSKDRFKLVIETKDQALFDATRSWADFLLFLDADVLLVEPGMFSNLTRLPDVIDDLAIVAPMLYSLGTYSNFWAGIDEKGYYQRTDDYLPILQRKRRGTFKVPMVHTAFFIDMRKLASRYLNFDPIDVNQAESNLHKHIPYDDIIAFAKSAEKYDIPLYVNNEMVWGFVPEPIASGEMALIGQRQDLIDLELEALVEADGTGFIIADILETYPDDVHEENIESNETYQKLGVDEVYVINLQRRAERRRRMLRSLKLLRVKPKLWNATDGRKLDKEYLDSYGIRVLPDYLDPHHGRPMTFGEIGCFLSHFRVWNHAWRNDYDKIIIFEDDVRFERNFRQKLAKALNEFDKLAQASKEEPPEFLYIGRKLNGNYEDEVAVYTVDVAAETTTSGRSMFVRPGYSYWTIGYMITRKGIGKLLEANPLRRLVPVDEFLPIMYRSHPNATFIAQFEQDEAGGGRPLPRLEALALRYLLVYPTHYVGDDEYISDTEDSAMTDQIGGDLGARLVMSAKNMPREEPEEEATEGGQLRLHPPLSPKVEL